MYSEIFCMQKEISVYENLSEMEEMLMSIGFHYKQALILFKKCWYIYYSWGGWKTLFVGRGAESSVLL
jgi:hypothetical protein